MKAVRAFVAFIISSAIILPTANLSSVLADVRQLPPERLYRYVVGSKSTHNAGVKLESYFVEEPKFVVAIHYPVLGVAKADEVIRRYLANSTATASARSIASSGPVTLFADFELFRYSPDVISLKFDQTLYGIGISTVHDIQTFTFDLRSGSELRLPELLRSPDALELLSDLCFRELSTHPELTNQTWVKNGLAPVDTSFSKFAFSRDTVRFFFPAGQVGPSGQEVELRLTDLQQLIHFALLNVGQARQVNRPGQKRIAITFDDGPHPTHTTKILNELKKRNAVATFFVVGESVAKNPQLTRRILREGSELGNHSWNHPDLTTLTREQVAKQIDRTNNIVREVTGTTPQVLRPPYGRHNAHVRRESGMPIVLWSIDPEDWQSKDVEHMLNHITSRAKNGDIILLHDIYSSTADLVGPLLDRLSARGFEFATVSELLEMVDRPRGALDGTIIHRK